MNHAKYWYNKFNIQELSYKQKRFRQDLKNMPRLSELSKEMIKNNINIIQSVIFSKRRSRYETDTI